MNISFKQLKAFVSIYELQSFTAAAKALHMTQSAVSKCCHEIEEEVGFPLFERTTRRMEPLAGAHDLYCFAQELLGTMDTAVRSLSALNTMGRGTLSIAAAQMIMSGLLGEALGQYRQLYPNIRLELHELSTDDTIRYVTEGKVDIGVAAIDASHPKLTIVPVYADQLCVACPKDHPWADQSHIKWAQLNHQDLITMRPVNALARKLATLMQQQVLKFVSTVETGSLPSALQMVQHGLGLAISPRYAEPLATQLGLKLVPLQGKAKDVLRELSLIHRSNIRLSRPATAFAELLKLHLRQHRFNTKRS